MANADFCWNLIQHSDSVGFQSMKKLHFANQISWAKHHTSIEHFSSPWALVQDYITYIKDYTQTSEDKLSSARTLSVNNVRCSQKILRLLDIDE
mgnify:CR=1 FL=1